MAKQTSAQRSKMKMCMGEFKAGTLHHGSETGPVVTRRDVAQAICLRKAGVPPPRGKKR